MNSEIEKKPGNEKNAFRKALRELPSRLLHIFLHNWPWKVLSVFLAICLWAGLITQDPTLTREKVFTDVPVTVSGADALKRNGLIVLTDLSAESLKARLRVDVPQREYNSVSVASYSPRIDLTKIVATGTQTLRIQTTSTTAYGTVKEINPDTVEVEVDQYTTRYRIPVTLNQEGDYPDGFYGLTPSLDPTTVAVSGPRTILQQIARAVVTFDRATLPPQSGEIRTAVPITLVDQHGEAIVSDLLQITSEGVLISSIIVDQDLYPTKTLQMNTLSLITGAPANGYEVKSVTVSPSVVLAAGEETVLSTLDSLFTEQAIDLNNATESFSAEVKVKKPGDLVYLKPDTVTVAVEIGAAISSRAYAGLKINVRDSQTGRVVKSDAKNVSVTITGPKLLLDALKVSALEPFVDVSSLSDGEYELPIFLSITGDNQNAFTYTVNPEKIKVTITTK